MSFTRIALVAGALAVGSFGSSAHAATACTRQVAGVSACTDTARPGCVYGGGPSFTFTTVYC